MLITTTDNNEFEADGSTPNPNFGVATQTTIPDPQPIPNSTTITGLAFVKRFTAQERAAVVNSADPGVKAFAFELQIAASGGEVSLLDPDTIAGINYLTTLTSPLLTTDRAASILTP